jgi:hypothetical protein
MVLYGLRLSGSGQGREAEFCEYSNEFWGSIKSGNLPYQLSDSWPLCSLKFVTLFSCFIKGVS